MQNKILIVEDEAKIRKLIKTYLEDSGFTTVEAEDGRKALDIFHSDNNIDFIVLDLMLPKISGEEVCQKIRQVSDIPILMLTAKSSEENKIEGFDYGADDYLTKPFSPRELTARIKAILRRTDMNKIKANILSFADGKIKIFPEEMRVLLNDSDVDLTNTEFKILLELVNNAGQVLSREQLADKVMGLEFNGFDRTIDAHIKNIRKKMELNKDEYIITVYGAGYKFVGDN
ncbi:MULTISPECIES: response regulator transcription factor [unclassified Halanaerobium]|uniref:response regulator transcription factor n=1 Tax=unclassified Halanaerobium TaxID=2641197 RepID=UPI000DF4A69D|nr:MULTISPECIES: response regulator transcription factor [unclassified Halanaerobium]RCW51507.1 DNA-binding response OmpR family regulator [Halanaerobium sp. MA284_MarDTE_T2]RCW89295.1 DNA-binding response OmpR family regulator [Halanaerobium sp. DL-01]